MSLLEVTETLCAHGPNDRPFIVGIDGLGGAGKTTFVKKLSQELKNRHREVIILPLDDYIVEMKKRYETGYEEWYEYYYLQWDVRLLETELFKKLRNNSTELTLPYYDRATDTIVPKHIHLTPSTIVLIEGVFLQRDEWRDYFDFVLFIDCSHEVRAERVLNRDLYIGDYQTRVNKYKNRYWLAEEHYIKSVDPKKKADCLYSTQT
ncbi:kinase [Halalkalibacterium halodurans]|uniref:kinase n=1 Tax=Halalkalibacterium halodurans TaxID=86665 RepID=UPI002E1A51C0|nr:kinase [Halalkalibacterium halodurans]MED4174568.1 kinase [Halalkalibacterium halodurans]